MSLAQALVKGRVMDAVYWIVFFTQWLPAEHTRVVFEIRVLFVFFGGGVLYIPSEP